MEVRCCCDCHLVGHLPDPKDGWIYPTMTFKTVDGELIQFEIATFYESLIEFVSRPMPKKAYKSKDYPLELLRKIPEFKEIGHEISLSEAKSVDVRPRLPRIDGCPPDG